MTLRAADIASRTDTGRQRRDNEDSSFARAPLFVIADGMGGAQAGEVASRLAIEAFADALPEEGSTEERLAGRAQDANREIYEMSRTAEERAGMGTTLTAVYVDETGLAVAHVGDSRAYLYRHGELGRLTQDHTLVEELLRRGKLTEEQAAEHPQRSIITRALGVDPAVEVDTRTYAGRPGDIVLLCSDGLTSMITEAAIVEVLDAQPDLERAAEALIAAANDAGGRDNITVILFRLEDAGGTTTDHLATDHPTLVGVPAVTADPGPGDHAEGHREGARRTMDAPATGRGGSATLTASRQNVSPAPPAARTNRPRPGGRSQPAAAARRRGPKRFARTLAMMLTVAIVVGLILAGGYLASRQLFFVGSNAQGVVTIYRGLPYDLPLGVRLYETFYVSGVPAEIVPAARRPKLFNHQLRSQNDAVSLVRTAELGQLTP